MNTQEMKGLVSRVLESPDPEQALGEILILPPGFAEES